MKPKFQPSPSRISAIQKLARSMPASATSAAGGEQRHADRDDHVDPVAGDQRAGDEARPEHREHVPLDAERRIVLAEAAGNHGERRRRHHQRHQAVGADAAEHGDDEARLAGDLRRAAGRPGATPWAARRAPGPDRNETIDQARRRRGPTMAKNAPANGIGRREVAGEDHRLRPDDRRRRCRRSSPRRWRAPGRPRRRCRPRRSGTAGRRPPRSRPAGSPPTSPPNGP